MSDFPFSQPTLSEVRREMRFGGLAQAVGPSMSDFSAEKYATTKMYREEEIS
ncbi:MAG: hypothetical protein Q7S75_01955 [bacterium]|nr:hypothetical protein [bacterium]